MKKIPVNRNLDSLKPSGIRKFFDIANEMKDVISLSIGEPDFQTPWHIRQAGIQAAEEGKTWYSPSMGFLALREEISSYLQRRFDLHYSPKSEVLVTVGASEAIDTIFRALINEGDEVLVIQPSFVCYDPLIRMSGGIPVILETKAENKFKLTANELKNKITPKTRMLVISFPTNPTGAIMEKEELEALAEVLRDTEILVLSDEIYCELNYTEKSHVSIASLPEMRERTILVNGFSKSYAMTGWRIGYTCAPVEIIEQLTKIHQYMVMCAPTISQYAAIEAMKHGDEDVKRMRNEYNMRRRYLVDRLNAMGLNCFEPEGAFYAFPCIRSTGLTSEEFCEKLIYSKQVAVVPGTAFGDCGEGFIRISYSYSLKHITEAMNRMESFLNELKHE
ncbi:MAG TPA: pyridoxal phosphate-dependent aminotransferase [Erysipelotrichaceae bacterium]|nr:MAG: aromatic amino acid aminotransferase [Firmicutes bacterium GWE2_51_13]HAM62139.1 pyridoxal phosphate-dependent aminotransferase [Erysipelotrichaceae bacterium]HAO61408.1 pyridoxal phosphate-dependent aminotransferase [Erysipelotrichaceae bacterium]